MLGLPISRYEQFLVHRNQSEQLLQCVAAAFATVICSQIVESNPIKVLGMEWFSIYFKKRNKDAFGPPNSSFTGRMAIVSVDKKNTSMHFLFSLLNVNIMTGDNENL